ncbi:AAA family ATPase [Ferrimonas aestuarii]|uniref:MoxR family ATPase n=1 Tax=Ferrimonas aestuarii TaxID=2569539 RepID=A0A4U1BV80_9GAMM|nr:MoxR family ATPase [Ferrimonas aestuarii]TKB58501.1 MoxR family ATPase [Ferrimonas aestuarii]
MKQQIDRVIAQLEQVLLDKPVAIRLALSCLIAKGHLLIEDLPGVGKTTLSQALATTLGLSHQRVQFTADMLPADLTGFATLNPSSQSFEFHPGPLFNQVVLADEINRASPKTQSALLEAMAEANVSCEGQTRELPSPFFVIATQNPQEQSGTFPLPESQLDRFTMRIHLGFPSVEAERQLLKGEHLADHSTTLTQQIDVATLRQWQQAASEIHMAESVLDYLLELIQLSRQQQCAPLSPRCSRALFACAKSWAFLHGRDFVTPDDVQAVFVAVTEHRLDNGSANYSLSSNLTNNRSGHLAQGLLELVNPIR